MRCARIAPEHAFEDWTVTPVLDAVLTTPYQISMLALVVEKVALCHVVTTLPVGVAREKQFVSPTRTSRLPTVVVGLVVRVTMMEAAALAELVFC